MDLFIRNLIGTIVRWVLTTVASYLVSTGLLKPEDQAQLIAGLAFAAATLFWGIYQKFVAKRVLEAALQLPAGATAAEAVAEARAPKPNG